MGFDGDTLGDNRIHGDDNADGGSCDARGILSRHMISGPVGDGLSV